jgi:hypothetical protein
MTINEFAVALMDLGFVVTEAEEGMRISREGGSVIINPEILLIEPEDIYVVAKQVGGLL